MRHISLIVGASIWLVMWAAPNMQPLIAIPAPNCEDTDPEARVLRFEAKSQDGGVRLEWRTGSERLTHSFAVGRSSSPDGPFLLVTSEIPGAGTDSSGSAYAVFDPTGASSDLYQLMETETTAPEWHRSVSGPIAVDEYPLPVDSVGTVATEGTNPNYPSYHGAEPQVADALIIIPDAWVSVTIDSLVGHWDTFRHHVTNLETLSQVGTTKEAIKARIMSGTEQYVLLVGDASMGEPADNIIPTWSVYDLDLGLNVVTDAPYGDRSGDGLSDIALGRWPVQTSAEAATCARKSMEYDGQSPAQFWRQTWNMFVLDNSLFPGGNGGVARYLANAMVADPPDLVYVSQLRASEIPCSPGSCLAQREQRAVSALNFGSHVVIGFGTVASAGSLVDFINSSRLDPNAYYANKMYSMFFGLSCGLGGFWVNDGPGAPLSTRPLAETFLTMSNKGAIGWLGPATDTYQYENFLVGKEIVSRLTYNGTTSAAMICRDALQAVAAADPYATVCASSYVFLGDPTLVLAWDQYDPPTGVSNGNGHGQKNYALAVRPNPGRGTFGLQFSLMRPTDVTLSIYDVAGRRVRVLATGPFRDGMYRSLWDGRDEGRREVAAGIYLVQLRTKEKVLNQKLVLMR